MKAFRVVLIGLIFSIYASAWADTFFSSYWGSINAKDYGAVGNGSTDDTAAIQAAIDAASAAKIQRVYLPPTGNCYKTTTSLFLDPPGNLRGSAAAWASGTTYAINNTVTYLGVPWISLGNGNVGNTPSTASTHWAQTTATPSIFSFSMTLAGEPNGGANLEGWGSRICPNFNNGTAVWVGPGQGMGVASIEIAGPQNTGYHGQLPSAGIGIGIAGGNGGASRTLVDNVLIWNFYTGYETGANGIFSLDDSNTLRKSLILNAYYGAYYSQTQNDVNDAQENEIIATIAYYSPLGRPVVVVGGNPSATSGQANSFSLSSISAITATSAGASFNYTFTAVISPDTFITGCPSANPACVYNSWMFPTAHMGVIPAMLTAFNSGTNTATFQIFQNWADANYLATNIHTATDLDNEIAAVATAYATERVTIFYGAAYDVTGIWMENPNACTTFLDSYSGFGGDFKTYIKTTFFNYDPGQTSWKPANSPTAPELALFYCQQSFPLIYMEGGGSATFESNSFSQNHASEPFIVDLSATFEGRLIFKGNTGHMPQQVYAPNVRNGHGLTGGTIITCSDATYGIQAISCAATGGGEWDRTPFLAHAVNNSTIPVNHPWATDYTEFWGSVPAWDKAPRLTPTEITALGSLGTIGTYNAVFGNVDYQVTDWNTGAPATHFARWAHTFASYGTNLTTSNVTGLTVTYKGQTDVVYLDSNSIGYMFSGLEISLNNGGTRAPYVVTGVYPALGYITVCETTSDTSFSLLAGTKTSVFTPSSILQASYSVTQF